MSFDKEVKLEMIFLLAKNLIIFVSSCVGRQAFSITRLMLLKQITSHLIQGR